MEQKICYIGQKHFLLTYKDNKETWPIKRYEDQRFESYINNCVCFLCKKVGHIAKFCYQGNGEDKEYLALGTSE